MADPIVVGITGASGILYGVRLLEVLRNAGIETHLVMSRAAGVSLRLELPEHTLASVGALAHAVHKENDVSACIASGSYRTRAMVVVPCSMKTLAAVATGYGDNLLARAADVTLKERRRLILVCRETPLHLVHLRNMVTATEMGAVILPPMVAFYQHPRTLAEVVDHTVGRILDCLDIPHELYPRWEGPR